MDHTSFLHASFAANSLKRKRPNLPEEPPASIIKDTRIKSSKALRVECQIIKIVVGPPLEPTEESVLEDDRESFYVHELAICDRSPYIANCMKPEWAEHRENPRTIELPDDDPAAFSLYLHYVYTRQLPVLPEDDAATSPGGFSTLADAYVLGERLMDIDFKNAIADAFVLYARGTVDKQHFYPSNEAIRTIYAGTREGSPIRQLLVDIWCYRGKHEWLEKDPDLPKDFMYQVMSGLLKNRKDQEHASRPWKKSHEQYYDH